MIEAWTSQILDDQRWSILKKKEEEMNEISIGHLWLNEDDEQILVHNDLSFG